MNQSSEYRQYIFGMIFLLSNKLQVLGDKVTGDLTLKQWLLLNMIKHHVKPSPNYNDIANVMHVTRQNVIKMISILEDKKYILTSVSEDDHRSVSVKLTKKTEQYFNEKEQLGNLFLKHIFQSFSDDELKLFKDIIDKLAYSIDYIEKGHNYDQ